MDVFEGIKNRRSTRAFTKKPVSEQQVTKLIDAARWAPSAGNIQPWKFVVVRDAETKRRLAKAALDTSFIEEAAVVIVVCTEQMRSARRYGSRGAKLYCLQDAAAATQNMLLAAHALGLGACWIGAFQEEEVRKVLNVPNGVRPVAIVPVGHSAEKPAARSRKRIGEITYHETFGRD